MVLRSKMKVNKFWVCEKRYLNDVSVSWIMSKESSKRVYMAREEVEKHLKGLKTDEAKLNYLGTILNRGMKGRPVQQPIVGSYDAPIPPPKGLLRPETEKSIRLAQIEIYKKHPEKWGFAARIKDPTKAFRKAGGRSF